MISHFLSLTPPPLLSLWTEPSFPQPPCLTYRSPSLTTFCDDLIKNWYGFGFFKFLISFFLFMVLDLIFHHHVLLYYWICSFVFYIPSLLKNQVSLGYWLYWPESWAPLVPHSFFLIVAADASKEDLIYYLKNELILLATRYFVLRWKNKQSYVLNFLELTFTPADLFICLCWKKCYW